MKAYVKLQSNVTVSVASGLQYEDHTRYDSDIPDRMNIKPNWPNMTVLLKKGTFWYPSEIMSWPVVKLYLEQGIVSKNDENDTPSDVKDDEGNVTKAEEVIEKREDLILAAKEMNINKKLKSKKDSSLDELAE